jgi:hypothetical protein
MIKRAAVSAIKRTNLRRSQWIMAVAVGFMASAGHAQDLQVGQPESLIEDTQALGLRFGTITAYPSISVDGRYDTNIYDRESDAEDDVIAVVQPALRLQSNWARHAALLRLAADIRRYSKHSAENSEQLDARASARLDMGERLTLEPSATIARRIELRGTFGDQLSDEPIKYVYKDIGLRLARTGGRLEASASAQYSDLRYSDASVGGVRIDESYRDVRHLAFNVRGDLRLSWRLGLFVTGNAERFSYDRGPFGSRNSTGYSLLGGAKVNATNLLQAEAAVGVVHVNFASPLANDFTGLDFDVRGSWTPRRWLRLSVQGQRTIERSPLINASAVIETRLVAGITYALSNRLLLGLEGGTVADQYRGTDRREHRRFAEASVQYRLKPTVSLFAAAGYRSQHAVGFGGLAYHGSMIRVGLKFTP